MFCLCHVLFVLRFLRFSAKEKKVLKSTNFKMMFVFIGVPVPVPVDEEGLVQISNLNIVLVSIVLRVTDLTA
jgi:hypothetical protein